MKHVRVLYHDDPEPKKFSGRKGWKFCYDDKYTDHEILDAVWEQWNAGSGHESKFFLNLGVRSMMVGDYVHILGGKGTGWHECLAIGWRINVPWEEVMGDTPKENFADITEGDVKNAIIKQLDLPPTWLANGQPQSILERN